MKLEEMKTVRDALSWALRRIETARLGCGDFFERAEQLRSEKKSLAVELYCYWPDGSRKYMSFDHWPQRDELPADAVRFDFAVPDPDFSECQIPPMGWRCTRSEGHEGPCAAVEAPEDAALVASAMQRLRGA